MAARGRRPFSPQQTEAISREFQAARDSVVLSSVVGIKLRKSGRELVGLCPFHPDRTPSFQVNDAKGTYHCFGCGRSGDAITFLVEKFGLTPMGALRELKGGSFPECDPAERSRRKEEDEAERAAAIAEAQRIWDKAVPAAGTDAEVYAFRRGIWMPLPPSIRFVRTYAWIDKESGEVGPDLPALIGAVTDGAGTITGLQRIFLRDGGLAKARMKKPKLSIGRIRGGALRLEPAVDDTWHKIDEVIITEGPEDGLSLAQEMPGRRVWVALGTAMMPEIDFPSTVRSIIIAGQNDEAGRAATEKAGIALVERGFAVSTIHPDPAFKDWNDQLRGIRK